MLIKNSEKYEAKQTLRSKEHFVTKQSKIEAICCVGEKPKQIAIQSSAKSNPIIPTKETIYKEACAWLLLQ
jgi:hypothetical protein